MFSEKLKELRKNRELSMEELSDSYNKRFDGKLNKSTLSRYENNLQEPMINVVKNLAAFFGVSLDYLTDESTDTSKGEFDIFSIPGIIPLPKTYKVPLIGNIACGTPILADENIEDYIDLSQEVSADYCLRCKGDSMINARIFDGDIVFIKQQDDVENGQIAVVLIDNEATLRRVYHGHNEIILRAENPTFAAKTLSGAELDNVCIQGLAVAFLSMVK